MLRKYFIVLLLNFLLPAIVLGQTNSPAPYCNGGYTSGNCLQGGPPNTNGNSVNDFIDSFNTSGGNTNISNNNSFCNGGPNNYVNYCQHYLSVNPGQTITCNVRSGLIYPQGFSIWVDWNQDNTFATPQEQVAATSNVPPAYTWTVLTFVIPPATPPGVYRMRVRCAFATNGTNITPCGTFGFGETEDYTIYVGGVPPTSGVPTATAVVSPSIVCVGQSLNFSVTTTYTSSLSYTWTGPNGFSATIPNPSIFSASLASVGIYTVIVSNTSCPVSGTVAIQVVDYPNLVVTPSPWAICQGGNFVAGVTPANTAQYSYQWQTSAPGTIFNPGLPSTLIVPSLLPVSQQIGTYNYSVTVTPTALSCPSTTFMTLTINNPSTPTLTMPLPQCNTFNPLQLAATPGGGTWSCSSATAAISPGGFFSPTLATIGYNYVHYTVSIGSCTVANTDSIQVSKFHTAALSASVTTRCVQDPLFDLMAIVLDTTTGNWSGTNVVNNMFSPANLPTGNYNLSYYSPSFPNPATCPQSTTLVMPVFNPPVPVINSITPVCNTAGTVQLTASPPGGVWSGNPGVSLSGIRTPSSNLIGTNSVTYTAGQNTCVASSSGTFHVSRFVSAALTGSINPACVNTPPFDLMTIVQNTTGTWSGIGVNTSNYFSPAGLPTNNYTLSYLSPSDPNPALCPDSRNLIVSVLNPQSPSITLVGPVCSVDPAIQLTVTPNNGQWVTTPYLTASGVFIPSLSAVGNNAIQYVIGTNTCNAQQMIQINTENFVPATVILPLPNLCNTSLPVNLNPFTANTLGTWSGPGVSGTNFNPATAGAGNFILVYKTASSPSGMCPDADTLAAKVFSLDVPTIGQAGPYCNNAKSEQLKVSPVGGLFGGNPAVNSGGVFNPALAPVGNNIVSYSISSGPCIAYAQSTIQVEKFVSAALLKQPSSAYCTNEEPFNLLGLVQNPGGTWSGPGVTPTFMFDPKNANIGSNNILTYHTQSYPNGLLCPDMSTVMIKVKEMPNPAVTTSSMSGCSPLTIAFNSAESPVAIGSWNFGDGSAEQNGFRTSHVFSRPGTYNVIYNYQDLEAPGCSTQVKLSSPVIVLAQPEANFRHPDEITITDPQVTFTNVSSSLYDNQYMWTIFGMGQYFELHPVVTFPQVGTYRVILKATDIAGCSSEITKFIEVKNDFSVFIPNAFSPNFDGLNDVFKPVFSPYGLDTKSYRMDIFDRWGKVIFTTKDYQTGWDGTAGNQGEKSVKNDSYNFHITFKDLDGKVYSREGVVTVMP